MSNRQTPVRRTSQSVASNYWPRVRANRYISAQRPKKVASKLKLTLLCLVILSVTGHFAWSQHVSAEILSSQRHDQQQAAEKAQRLTVFRNRVSTIIADYPELKLAVATASSSGPVQAFGTPENFDAASTAKLLTACDILHQIETNSLSLGTLLNGSTVQQLLKLMIINSDDAAWASLNQYLGHNNMQHYAHNLGIMNYNADTNSLSARDITLLLQQIYGDKLLNSEHHRLLLSYLEQANYRDYAVAAVPSSYKVFHKIGMNGDNLHDALIIDNGQTSLMLTIFTDGQGTYNWSLRKQVMQAITKAALDAYL